MVTLVAVVIVAALWRPVRLGALLLAGAAIPMAAQAISALVQVSEPVSATTLASPRHRPRRPGSGVQRRPHARVLDLLRVRGRAAHGGRVDGYAAAPGQPLLRPAREPPVDGSRGAWPGAAQ